METNNSKTVRYDELDALRGIAALMTVFFHFTMHRPQANVLFRMGNTGVDLFFIISGFVIFMSLAKISNSKQFIINRFCRLYPTYWAAVSFTFLLLASEIIFKGGFLAKQNYMQYLENMTMFQYYLGVPNLDGPYWSMIMEMVFYIFILLLFRIKLLEYAHIIGLVLCVSFTSATYYFNNQSTHLSYLLYYFPLLSFLPLFCVGIIFYKIYTNKTQLYLNYGMIFIFLLCQALMFKYVDRSFISNKEYYTMLAVYFVLFFLFVNNKLRFIVNRQTLFFGKISYALYLVHQCVSLNFLMPFLMDTLHINFWLATVFITLPIVTGIAAAITFYVEIPLGKKIKEKLYRLNTSNR